MRSVLPKVVIPTARLQAKGALNVIGTHPLFFKKSALHLAVRLFD